MTTKIIDDLTHIPNIIAGLGLSVAEAQRHFDLDYLQSIERLIVMARSLLGGRKHQDGQVTDLSTEEKQRLEQFQSVIKDFLVALAPGRYQFTETTLSVRLDLAQHLEVSAGGGLSAGIGGVAINGSVSAGYGTDYRGAAECKVVLHAVPIEQTTLRSLLDRARELSGKDQALPERSKVDSAVHEQAGNIFERIIGARPASQPAVQASSAPGAGEQK